MIKVIAFDFVGVLVKEKDIDLSYEEDRLERLFGDNISDSSYMEDAKDIVKSEDKTTFIVKNIINKLYEVKNKGLFNRIKTKYPNIKILIATNHVSYIRDYIYNNFSDFDDLIISSIINKIKPNRDFYQYILDKYNIEANELLFIDDSIRNIEGAKNLGIETIKVNTDTDLVLEIENKLDKNVDF